MTDRELMTEVVGRCDEVCGSNEREVKVREGREGLAEGPSESGSGPNGNESIRLLPVSGGGDSVVEV